MKNEPLTRTRKLEQKLNNVEAKLDKNRPSVMVDGWQTQRYAKKARNWDYYAKEKMAIISQLEMCYDKNRENMCDGCDCMKSRFFKNFPLAKQESKLDACNNEDGNEMCNNCDCWKLTREYCS